MNLKHLAAALALTIAVPALASNGTSYRPVNNQNYAEQDAQDWKEINYTLPDYPVAADWVGYYVPLKNDFKFYVDAKSLTLGSDGVIRLILRVVSASGAENLSFEGFQCANRNMRAYAFGDSINHRWIESTREVWSPLSTSNPARARLVEDLCPEWNTPASATDAIQRLRKSSWN